MINKNKFFLEGQQLFLKKISKKILKNLEKEHFIKWNSNLEDTIIPNTPFLIEQIEDIDNKLHNLYVSLIAQHLTDNIYPVVYQGENDGNLIRHVAPFKDSEDKVSSQGSKQDFLPHVDNPDLRIIGEPVNPNIGNCPETLTLFCLRGKTDVYTSIIKLDDILNKLSDNDKDVLLKPFFKVNRPASFKNNSFVDNVPILSLHNNTYYSRFDWHNTSGLNKVAIEVLEKIKSISIDKRYWHNFCLKQGEAITFLNQRVLHSRNKYKAEYDGNDRWLIRIFGVFDKPLKTQLIDPYNCKHNLKTQ